MNELDFHTISTDVMEDMEDMEDMEAADAYIQDLKDELAEARRTLLQVNADHLRMRRALEKAAKQFREYATLHAAKDPPQETKALVNRQMAEICEAALKPGVPT